MSDHINAMPTKAFFVDMLVRDIPLDRAILDLIDNCVDGAKRLRSGDSPDFSELWVEIEMSGDSFIITDNCGGFDTAIARDYAFRFGRPAGVRQTDYSIGQFGVGMKRALFKFGRYFEVHSTTAEEDWSMHVDVDTWEEEGEDPWQFNFTHVDHSGENDECGTRIVVNRLRPEVSSRFANGYFQRHLAVMIRSHQRQFMSYGLSIQFNGDHLINTNLRLLAGNEFQPAVEEFILEKDSDTPIHIRIVVGIGESSPDVAGWYIVCNGRVVLSADRSEATGWGSVAEQRDGTPKYHNQYARFRGIAFFNCKSSEKLPWNTTKTGLDGSSPTWQAALQKMLDHTRVAIRYLNELDRNVDEYGSGSSPLLTSLKRGTRHVPIESFITPQDLAWNRNAQPKGPPMTKIQYSRERTKIDKLMTALGVTSAKAVGEATFDALYKEQERDEDSE